MIDNDIEKALSPDKPDWKEPLWAKFKSYALGFGAAVVFVALVLTAVYFWLKPEPLAPQTEPTMTIEPIPQVTAKAPAQKRAKVATEKIAAQAINTRDTPDMGIPVSVPKPRIDDGFTAEFDKQVLNFESKL